MTAAQTELNQVKREVYDYLFLQLGYPHEIAKSVSDGIREVISYWNGRPSIVRTDNGYDMYL